jgi:hypothetical protein
MEWPAEGPAQPYGEPYAPAVPDPAAPPVPATDADQGEQLTELDGVELIEDDPPQGPGTPQGT